MAQTLDRYKRKSAMTGTYSGDETLNIGSHFQIIDDIIYMDGISTGINVVGKNGKSAYELAVSHGYPGSELEWLASLKGRDGYNGVNGTDGKDGADGADGKDAYQQAVDLGLFTGTEEEFYEQILAIFKES